MQCNRLQRSARDVGCGRSARDTQHGASGVAIPVRRAQPGECRHQVDVARVINLLSQCLHLLGRTDQPETVTQPLHCGSGDKHRSLQRVTGAACMWYVWRPAPGDGGQQLVPTRDCRGAGIHQHEATRAVGILRHPGLETSLSESGRLLVPCQAGDLQRRAKQLGQCRVDTATGGNHLGQDRTRYVKQRQQLFVPGQRVDVEQKRARRVAGVGYMATPTCQIPYEPTVDGAKREFASICPCAHPRHVVQQPLQLGARKVGVEHQAGLALDHRRAALRTQAITLRGGSAVLPDDRMGHGLARLAIPQHGGFTLVGDANAHNLCRADGRRLEHSARDRQLCVPDLRCVVLDPARAWKDLAKLLLRDSRTVAGVVEQNSA